MIEFYNTLNKQIELLPRITIIYGRYYSYRGIGFEWLWFGVFVYININNR